MRSGVTSLVRNKNLNIGYQRQQTPNENEIIKSLQIEKSEQKKGKISTNRGAKKWQCYKIKITLKLQIGNLLLVAYEYFSKNALKERNFHFHWHLPTIKSELHSNCLTHPEQL